MSWKSVQLTSNNRLKNPEKIQDFRRLMELLDVGDFCMTKTPQEGDEVHLTPCLVYALSEDITTESLLGDERANALEFLSPFLPWPHICVGSQRN